MIDLFLLILFCFLIANRIETLSKTYDSVWVAVRRKWRVKILYVVLLLALILFSGLRTTYNDTSAYMHAYTMLDIESKSVDIAILSEAYGGFDLLQILLKRYVSVDAQTLIAVSSVIANVLYTWFFAKHSKCFALTILSYFILGPYVFSMAGIKQILAMSISLLAIDNMLKKKYIKFVLWLLFAMTFHPYIICLLVLPLFFGGIWNGEMVIIIILVILGASNLELLIEFAGSLGKDYSLEELTGHTINPMRVVVEMLPILVSFLSRRRLRRCNDKLLNLGINMMILNAIMIFIGLFMNPIYFGRIGTYFASINAITVPFMLNVIYENHEHRKHNLIFYYAFYVVYFVLDLTKLGSISIFYDLFNHIKLF